MNFDFDLTGCAGAFGNASADLHITVRLRITPPSVSALLESFNIDAVSSRFGLGDSDITSGLSNTLYQQSGVDLIGATLPAGTDILAAIVDEAGNVDVYQEPMCMSSAMVRRAAQTAAEATLTQIHRLRDEPLFRGPQGKQFTQLVDRFDPMLTEAIRTQPDAARLREQVSRFPLEHFHEHADLEKLSREIAEPNRRAVDLLNPVAKNRQAGDVLGLPARDRRRVFRNARRIGSSICWRGLCWWRTRSAFPSATSRNATTRHPVHGTWLWPYESTAHRPGFVWAGIAFGAVWAFGPRGED